MFQKVKQFSCEENHVLKRKTMFLYSKPCPCEKSHFPVNKTIFLWGKLFSVKNLGPRMKTCSFEENHVLLTITMFLKPCSCEQKGCLCEIALYTVLNVQNRKESPSYIILGMVGRGNKFIWVINQVYCKRVKFIQNILKCSTQLNYGAK